MGMECSADGLCIEPCKPACSNKECGPDGCGGSCGECAAGSECQGGLCITTEDDTGDAGATDPGKDKDAYGSLDDSTGAYDDAWTEENDTTGSIAGPCPEGQEMRYGKCVSVKPASPGSEETTGGDPAGGCSVHGTSRTAAGPALLLSLALAVLALRRVRNGRAAS
jgi:MYXO-CTERM domain-containing protein